MQVEVSGIPCDGAAIAQHYWESYPPTTDCPRTDPAGGRTYKPKYTRMGRVGVAF